MGFAGRRTIGIEVIGRLAFAVVLVLLVEWWLVAPLPLSFHVSVLPLLLLMLPSEMGPSLFLAIVFSVAFVVDVFTQLHGARMAALGIVGLLWLPMRRGVSAWEDVPAPVYAFYLRKQRRLAIGYLLAINLVYHLVYVMIAFWELEAVVAQWYRWLGGAIVSWAMQLVLIALMRPLLSR